MDHVTSEDRNVVERYLLGRLSAAAAARFEDHYLDCPECLEKLELSRRLRDGLRDVAAEEGTHLARTAVVAWLLRRGRAFQAGLAVAVLALTILPWALLAPEVARLSGERQRVAGDLVQALSPQIRTPAYSLSPERSGPGAEPSTRVTLRSAHEWVVLALQLPPSESPPTPGASGAVVGYRLRFLGAEPEPLWRSEALAPDASGRVTLSVHSSWLETADYVVELEALDQGGISRSVARFTFRVRRDE